MWLSDLCLSISSPTNAHSAVIQLNFIDIASGPKTKPRSWLLSKEQWQKNSLLAGVNVEQDQANIGGPSFPCAWWVKEERKGEVGQDDSQCEPKNKTKKHFLDKMMPIV